MFAEAFEDILRGLCTPDVVRAIEAGSSPAALWAGVADAGFLDLLTPEEHGGAGLPLAELFPLMRTLGAYAMPVPFAQAIAARSLLQPGQAPAGLLTLAPALRRDQEGRLHAPLVPFGCLAGHVLAQEGDQLYLLRVSKAERVVTGVHGSTVASLIWASGQEPIQTASPRAIEAFGAALHAALMAGAMQRVFAMTLQYANDRAQFGKSIGKFQAVQHQISVMAEHVAASAIAAEAAFQDCSKQPALIPAAMAKSRTSEAAVLVASIAHAVHGAIGVTEEFDLQLYTRRLHEWRTAHGSESYWNRTIGLAVLQSRQPTIADFVRITGI